jgi:GNAT superfamily N-acetyltransferase
MGSLKRFGVCVLLFLLPITIFHGLRGNLKYMSLLLITIIDPSSVAVDPSYQRKGIGKVLMQWGLDRAEKDGKDVCLSASVAGQSLYLKLGFEVVDSRDILGEQWTAMVKRHKS